MASSGITWDSVVKAGSDMMDIASASLQRTMKIQEVTATKDNDSQPGACPGRSSVSAGLMHLYLCFILFTGHCLYRISFGRRTDTRRRAAASQPKAMLTSFRFCAAYALNELVQWCNKNSEEARAIAAALLRRASSSNPVIKWKVRLLYT